MNYYETALLLDARDAVRDAALAYELAISEQNAPLAAYLNLAVLYFNCLDFGYASHHRLEPEFVNIAEQRLKDVLARAHGTFGESGEIRFWRLFFDFVQTGTSPGIDEWLKIAEAGDTKLPFMYLFVFANQSNYRAEAEKLVASTKGETARERYIRSVIDGAMKRYSARNATQAS